MRRRARVAGEVAARQREEGGERKRERKGEVSGLAGRKKEEKEKVDPIRPV